MQDEKEIEVTEDKVQFYVAEKTIANSIGLPEAIFIGHVRYYVQVNASTNANSFAQGKYWSFSTYEALANEYMSFTSPDAIKDIVKRLTQMKIILKGNHHTNRDNRTNWYRYEEDALYEYLSYWGETGNIRSGSLYHKFVLDAYLAYKSPELYTLKYTKEYLDERMSDGKINETVWQNALTIVAKCHDVIMAKCHDVEVEELEVEELEVEELKTYPAKSLLQEEKPSPLLKRPTVGNVSFEGSSKPTLKDEGRQTSPSEWLSGIFKQFWGKELTEAQIKTLSKPVSAVLLTHSGLYPSPMEYADDIQYGKLFRQWIMEKKNPKDPTIRTVGAKGWINNHVRNYDSPEGFLLWCLKQGVTILPSKPDSLITVMVESTLYNLVEMDYYCFSRSGSPKSEAEISLTFKDFYIRNVERVKTNEEFLKLWENR